MIAIVDACKEHIAKPIKEKWLNPPPVVSVLPLQGVIGATNKLRGGGLNADSLEPLIKKAVACPRIKAVALLINSPGGSPVQSARICNLIRYEAEKKDIPVIAFIDDLGASGGYWLACTAKEIYAMDSSIIGSIGVVAASFGLDKFIEKHNIERRIYTQGKNKGMLDPFLPEKAEDVKKLKDAQADVFESFKEHVKSSRGDRLTGKESELFTGAIWSGKQAKALGLVDGLGDIHTICREKFGDDIQFRSFKDTKGFLSKKLGMFAPAAWANAAADVIEERIMWNRFGL